MKNVVFKLLQVIFNVVFIAALAQSHDGLVLHTQNLESLREIRPDAEAVALREGFISAGDGGQATYKWSPAACSLKGGAGDNGAQVKSNLVTGCWLANSTNPLSILVWGADASGAKDSTQQLQAALDSGLPIIQIPCGTFKVKSVKLPNVRGFRLVGLGSCSRLEQLPSDTPMLRWDNSKMEYPEGYILNLLLDGTHGTSDMINTAGAGGETIEDLFINNLPVAHSGIVVSGFNKEYTHDVRIENIQIYSITAGFAGIKLTGTSSDDEISKVIMNGNFNTRYALVLEEGAQSVKVSSSHLYNVSDSVLVVSGKSADLQFENCTFDNSRGDIAVVSHSKNVIFTHDFFESIGSGSTGLTLVDSQFVSVFNSIFSGSNGAQSAVSEDVFSDYNQVIGGTINWANFKTAMALRNQHSSSQFIAHIDASPNAIRRQ